MSKGTDRYTFRLPQELMVAVATTIYRRNLHTDREPWELSEFVRVAIKEKLAKMERSRRHGGKRRRVPSPADPGFVADVLSMEGVEPAKDLLHRLGLVE